MKGLLDFIYPRICLSCKNKLAASSVDNIICWNCWQKIEKNKPPFCHSCGRQLKKADLTKGICPECANQRFYFDRAFSPCIYTGVIKELIREFKYKNKDRLGKILSRLMIEFIKEYNLPMQEIDFIIPVPLHKIRLREREFNQAEILGKFIAQKFNKNLLTDILIRTRATKSQTELQPVKRLENIKGSFSIRNDLRLKGKNILLIDDVLTTGSTSSEAALTLKNAGAKIVFALSLAN